MWLRGGRMKINRVNEARNYLHQKLWIMPESRLVLISFFLFSLMISFYKSWGIRKGLFTKDSREHTYSVSIQSSVNFISMWLSFHIDGWKESHAKLILEELQSQRYNSTWDKWLCPCSIFSVLCVPTWTVSIWFQNGLGHKRDVVLPCSAISYYFPPVRVNPVTPQIRLILSLHYCMEEADGLPYATITLSCVTAPVSCMSEAKTMLSQAL